MFVDRVSYMKAFLTRHIRRTLRHQTRLEFSFYYVAWHSAHSIFVTAFAATFETHNAVGFSSVPYVA